MTLFSGTWARLDRVWARVGDRGVGMDVLVQRDSEGFVRWLDGYVGRFGVEAVVTDDLNTYKPAVEHVGVITKCASRTSRT